VCRTKVIDPTTSTPVRQRLCSHGCANSSDGRFTTPRKHGNEQSKCGHREIAILQSCSRSLEEIAAGEGWGGRLRLSIQADNFIYQIADMIFVGGVQDKEMRGLWKVFQEIDLRPPLSDEPKSDIVRLLG